MRLPRDFNIASVTEAEAGECIARGTGRENESVVKKAGDIDGQPFDLEDLSHCEVVLADHSEQVQVDNLTDCR